MNEENILSLIAISRIEGVGPRKLEKIIKVWSKNSPIWGLERSKVESILGPNLTSEWLRAGRTFNPEREKKLLDSSGQTVLYYQDDNYPSYLKELSDFPPLLFAQGNLSLLNAQVKKLAVVGARKPSTYGPAVVQKIVPELARQGVIIVSGLALGIDALAHLATISSAGATVAILGSGLDLIYPSSNVRLASNILDSQGLLLSEFPPGTPPLKPHFPRRNRLIAGLSDGVLVIEARADSGSLITANLASDYNRDLFAVPGDITRTNSLGGNKLLQNGATPVLDSQDIIDYWQLPAKNKINLSQTTNPELSPQEQALIELMEEEIPLDELAIRLDWPISQTGQLVSQLELAGIVQKVGGGYYKKI